MTGKLTIILAFSLLSVVMIDAVETNTTVDTTTHAATTRSADVSTAQLTTQSIPEKYWVVYYNPPPANFCVIMDANIYFVQTANKTETDIYMDTNNTVATGTCGDLEDSITLHRDDLKLTLTFSRKTTTDRSYSVSRIEVYYQGHLLNITEIPSWLSNMDSGKQYSCTRNYTVYNGELKTSVQIQISLADLQVEAFQNSTDVKFRDSVASCDNTDNLIPIVVGAALGGLIIIVLIAYLVGRQRSRRGYESV